MKNIIQGRDFGKTIEILDGIDQQDNIVVNPSDSIEDGLTVRMAPPSDQSKKNDSKPGDSNNGNPQQTQTQSKESSL
jgi:hypothetical protein